MIAVSLDVCAILYGGCPVVSDGITVVSEHVCQKESSRWSVCDFFGLTVGDWVELQQNQICAILMTSISECAYTLME